MSYFNGDIDDIVSIIENKSFSYDELKKLEKKINTLKLEKLFKLKICEFEELFSDLSVLDKFNFTTDEVFDYYKDYSYKNKVKFMYNGKVFTITIHFNHKFNLSLMNNPSYLECNIKAYIKYDNKKINILDDFENIHNCLEQFINDIFKEIDDEDLNGPDRYEPLCKTKKELLDFAVYLNVDLHFIFKLLTKLIVKMHYMNVPLY